jgi:regulator of sigma E protease
MFLVIQGFWAVVLSIIAFVFILGTIILIHEGGHFLFAKRAGILCHEFSLGMGPVIYKKKFGETYFCLRAIPIGGFVSMAGEEVTSQLIKTGDMIGLNLDDDGKVKEIILDEKMDAQIRGEIVDADLYGKDGNALYINLNTGGQNQYFEVKRDAFYIFSPKKSMQITPYDRSFESKSLLDRFLTIFAGPFMNFVLAIFVYLIVSFATGVPNYDSNVIGDVTNGYNSYGILETGDQIVSLDGQNVTSWDDLSKVLEQRFKEYDTEIDVVYIRDGVEYTEKINVIVAINSIGLTNIQASTDTLEVEGIRVGNVGLRYKDDKNVGDYPLASGDIITKVQIDDQEPIVITSWGKMAEVMNSISVANIRFEYYSQAKGGIVTIDECAIIESWSNETLDNQRIEKIAFKLGISPETHFAFFGCIGQAGVMFWDDFTLIFRTLKLLIAPSEVRQVGISDLSGFVGIFSMVMSFINAGFVSLLAFAALLSVNIGVMNLLPIPALDGGRLVFLLYELITRRKPSKKVENTINNVFFILLMLLFVFITFNDVLRLFK